MSGSDQPARSFVLRVPIVFPAFDVESHLDRQHQLLLDTCPQDTRRLLSELGACVRDRFSACEGRDRFQGQAGDSQLCAMSSALFRGRSGVGQARVRGKNLLHLSGAFQSKSRERQIIGVIGVSQ